MRRALAKWRWAGVGVVWDACDPDDEPREATAETMAQPPAVHVHYHLHLAPGADPAGTALALQSIRQLPQREAIATEVITEGTGEQQ